MSATGMAWLGVIFVPLALALLLTVPAWRRVVTYLAPAMALPVLWLLLTTETGTFVDLPWLLIGVRFGIDATARIFLLFTSILYFLIGLDALFALHHHRVDHRFFAYYLCAMSGNLGLVLAQDAASFYSLFALMSFSGFGLVAYSHSRRARSAARVYIVMVMLSEVLIFTGLVIAVDGGSHYLVDLPRQVLSSPLRNLCVALLIAGFGIKVGMFPLHIWLPVSYRAAPIPAAALLSACMSKAGILGWMRCLPAVGEGLPGWGAALILGGFFTALYAGVVGLHQRDPKSVLAYSSMSKMGMLAALAGMALISPAAAGIVTGVTILYVLHHAAAKSALFLGLGMVHAMPTGRMGRILVWIGLTIPALSLAGLPWTSGFVAKAAMKEAAHASLPHAHALVVTLLPLMAILTTMLMARFFLLAWGEQHPPAERSHVVAQFIPWGVIVLGVLSLPVAWKQYGESEHLHLTMTAGAVGAALWPFAVGLLLAFLWRYVKKPLRIPCGDLLHVYLVALESIPRAVPRRLRAWARREYSLGLSLVRLLAEEKPHAPFGRLVDKGEARLQSWSVFGSILLLIGAIAFALVLLV